jgi:hypothetical protein
MAVPTLSEQADLIEYLLLRCRMLDGMTAGETWLLLTKDDCEQLKGLQARLDRMAPHEEKIRKVVTGK